MKTIEQQFKVLSEIDHILHRPGMYIGSLSRHIANEYIAINDGDKWLYMKAEMSYVPAFIKIFNEILDNAIDEHKRNPTNLNIIKVDIAPDGYITVEDNGGIPVQIHSEFGKYVPEIIFGQLRSGSNYNDEDDQSLIGTNGIGSKATNVFSKEFIIETCDGEKTFKQEFKNNMKEKSEPVIKSGKRNHTRITFLPDYERFGFKFNIEDDHVTKIFTAVINAAGCNPTCKFFINGDRIQIKDFQDYVRMYHSDFVFEETNDWKVAVAHSETEEFEHTSFVNSVNTYEGGTHVDYIALQIANKLREFFEKKHKVDVTPSMLRNHMHLFISCNINRPRFDSQTKSRMISEYKEYKTSFEISDKFITRLTKSPIILSVLDWVFAKQQAQEAAELRKLNKETSKSDPRKIEKFIDASSKNRKECILFLCEGDSAKSSVVGGRDPKTMAAYPLKGKPLNVFDVSHQKLIDNKEFQEMMQIIGIRLGEKVESVDSIRYGKIAICSDQDLDGFHIRGLLQNIFNKFWVDLLKLGVIYIFRTPLLRVKTGNEVLSFFSSVDFQQWKTKNPNVKIKSIKYFKGLGTSKPEDFKQYFKDMDQHLIQLEYDGEDASESIDLAFNNKRADDRKKWVSVIADGE